jgi:rare lipoprotein A
VIELLIATALLTKEIPTNISERGSGRIERVIVANKPSYGIASWYGGYFHGRKTASGITFNEWGNTCAHNQFEFGTKLKVTNVANGKSTVCLVQDTGNFNKLGRIIDLSKGSFKNIASLKQGLVRVKLEKI